MALQSMAAIANITLQASSPAITFSGVPQTYRDLVVVYNGQTVDSGNFDIRIHFNGDTSNFSFVAMGGTGSSTYSYTASSTNTFNPGTGNRTVGVYQVMDYSATDKHKTTLIRVNSSNSNVGAGVQRWGSTASITSVTVSMGSGNYAAGSTFSLYGRIA